MNLYDITPSPMVDGKYVDISFDLEVQEVDHKPIVMTIWRGQPVIDLADQLESVARKLRASLRDAPESRGLIRRALDLCKAK